MLGPNVNDSREPFDPLSGTSTTLLRNAVAADELAWNELVEKYADAIYGWCRHCGVPRGDATDVVQDVLETLARSLGRFRNDRDNDTFRGWLRQITISRSIDHLRRLDRDVAVAEGGARARTLLGLHPSAAEEQSSVLNRKLARLNWLREGISDRDWTICCELLHGTATGPELAARFSLQLDYVYVIKSRVIKRLRAKREARNHEDAGAAGTSLPFPD